MKYLVVILFFCFNLVIFYIFVVSTRKNAIYSEEIKLQIKAPLFQHGHSNYIEVPRKYSVVHWTIV